MVRVWSFGFLPGRITARETSTINSRVLLQDVGGSGNWERGDSDNSFQRRDAINCLRIALHDPLASAVHRFFPVSDVKCIFVQINREAACWWDAVARRIASKMQMLRGHRARATRPSQANVQVVSERNQGSGRICRTCALCKQVGPFDRRRRRSCLASLRPKMDKAGFRASGTSVRATRWLVYSREQ